MPKKQFTAVDSHYPLYRRDLPETQHHIKDFAGDVFHIDLTNAHTEPYPADPGDLAVFTKLFDARAAAAISDLAGLGNFNKLRLLLSDPPRYQEPQNVLLDEQHQRFKDGQSALVPKEKCLALLAFPDYFSEWPNPGSLQSQVSAAIMYANPGWCGTFGAGVDSAWDLWLDDPSEGNYDMSQMHLLQIAYSYYDELTPQAREKLIRELLATGRIHRPDADDIVTSGRLPLDWSRAGHVYACTEKIRIGETENHILTIHTARYLTNQLLYQRDHDADRDNRRNSPRDGDRRGLTCMNLLLYLLRCMLRDDFSEYNAKPYQTETRSALLNLCTYAYDHEVRLAARMVLDYISAHVAVSSNDLRRMVPFRRLNKDEHVTRLSDSGFNRDFLGIGLLDGTLGADPMAEPYAIQAGNTRAYETGNAKLFPPDFKYQARPWTWAIASDGGAAVAEAVSNYRLPPLIHDLFVNDPHRRFFQRLHRTIMMDEVEGAGAMDEDARGISGRNADNMEIYASSPSYLITAGGAPASYAIDPGPSLVTEKGWKKAISQRGAAVPTSFMPTGRRTGEFAQNNAADIIQFGAYAYAFKAEEAGKVKDYSPTVANYGVAPDFACGHIAHLPNWVGSNGQMDGPWLFVNLDSPTPLPNVKTSPPGFYLAIFSDGNFTLLEAYDTWLHKELTFEAFKQTVKANNPMLRIVNNAQFRYRTCNRNLLDVVIWNEGVRPADADSGARIMGISYGRDDPQMNDPNDALGDAGNDQSKFLNGTILNTLGEAVIEIRNPGFNNGQGGTIVLDMSDQRYPRRISEFGEVEQAGYHNEVWVDFNYTGPTEGDFFQPFNTLAGAIARVAEGGVIKVMPGVTKEKAIMPNNKRVSIVAPIGGVVFG